MPIPLSPPLSARMACLSAVAAALVLVSVPASASGPSFTSMVVFGDSLSDTGNLFALTGGTYPLFPYDNGRFSNGPLAVEWLASGLGLTGPKFDNWAIAGATTDTWGSADASLGGYPTGMLSQLAGYQSSLGGGSADSAALYFVMGGANDLRYGDLSTPLAASHTVDVAVANLKSIVTSLHALGAQKFFLPNLPDLGLTPESVAGGTSAGSSALSALFNQRLAAAYDDLKQTWSDETFYDIDLPTIQYQQLADAPANGFTSLTDQCILTAGCVASNAAGFVYWDNVHPSAATHAILGAAMLAAVPEPESLLLVALAGLALLGTRRRRLSA